VSELPCKATGKNEGGSGKMKEQKLIPMVKGYKATNGDMKCNNFQFKLGKVFIHDGELEMCKSGFHFCIYPSGIWSFYDDANTRVFEVEAYDVLDKREGDGAEVKMVAKKIKFVREVKIGGYRNTCYRNTGYRNTGYRNTGYSNTGNSNTGNSNTGYRNTGDWNTGYRNTGNSNTGNSNTGYRNTGDWNTGYWNSTNFSSGFFCLKEPNIISFDTSVKNITRENFLNRIDVSNLGIALTQDAPIDWEMVKTVPNITKEKLKELHKRFIEARKVKSNVS